MLTNANSIGASSDWFVPDLIVLHFKTSLSGAHPPEQEGRRRMVRYWRLMKKRIASSK